MTEDTLQGRMRALRDHIAKSNLSKWEQPGTPTWAVGPQLDSVVLTIIDYAHHLESRLAILEAAEKDGKDA